jgi:hypothetical protein
MQSQRWKSGLRQGDREASKAELLKNDVDHVTASQELLGHTARSQAMSAEHAMQNFYNVTVQTDSGTRVARFDRFADAMAAYENARVNGAISAAVDRIQHTPHGALLPSRRTCLKSSVGGVVEK